MNTVVQRSVSFDSRALPRRNLLLGYFGSDPLEYLNGLHKSALEFPVNHVLEEILDAYLQASGLLAYHNRATDFTDRELALLSWSLLPQPG